MNLPRYTDTEHAQAYEHFTAFVDRILKQCDEFSAKVQEGSKLLTEAQENLSEALKGISLTGDFAKVSRVTDKRLSDTRMSPNSDNAGYALSETGATPVPRQAGETAILEAERKHYANQHRLEQEYAQRFPNENQD